MTQCNKSGKRWDANETSTLAELLCVSSSVLLKKNVMQFTEHNTNTSPKPTSKTSLNKTYILFFLQYCMHAKSCSEIQRFQWGT